MRIYRDMNLNDFRFWEGAADTASYLYPEELDTIETALKASNPEGMEATELNDFFWFEDETIAQILGYKSFEEIVNRENEEDEEDEEENVGDSIYVDGDLIKPFCRIYVGGEEHV